MIDKEQLASAVTDKYQTCIDMGVDLPEVPIRYGAPCPVCGGKDRFSYDPKWGNFFCRSCGSMDYIKLIMEFHSWSFSDTINQIGEYLGLTTNKAPSELLKARKLDRAKKTYTKALTVIGLAKGYSGTLSEEDKILYRRAKNYANRYEERVRKSGT